MKKVADLLIGNEGELSLEKRVYNFCVLLGSALTFISVIADWFSYRVFSAINCVFFLVWLTSYMLTRFKGHYRFVVPVTIFLLSAAFFPLHWLAGWGIEGVMPCYSILFAAVICVVMSGRARLIMIGIHIAVQTLLILFGNRFYGAISEGITHHLLQVDMLVHLTVVTASISAVIIAYLVSYQRERRRSEALTTALSENYRQQLYYMENLEQLVKKLRSERHDFDNRLGIIYGMLEGAEADKAKEYAASLIGASHAHHSIVQLPYSMLRAMINYKLSVASELDIRLSPSAELREGLSFNEPDLAIIIGTLMDNAIEACRKAPDMHIAFSLCYKPDYLILRVENSVEPGAQMPSWMGGPGASSKPDPENHGFGLSNVKYLVEKQGGLIEIGLQKDVFRVNIALLVEAEDVRPG
ncbi:MAG: GHKL domain-containing protein [Clostridiales bacterium]|nr:GHKL domain-containing protein [Clostridiales bacterium]